MNHELKQRLKTMSMLPHDPGLAAFRALFRRRAGDAADRVESTLRNMILTMPETLERVRMQSTVPGVPRHVRTLHAYLLTYLYEPRDLVPEEGNGFFGYLDDAYLVAAAHHRTAGRFDPQVTEYLDAATQVIPAEAAQLDGMLDGLLAGKTEPYQTALGY